MNNIQKGLYHMNSENYGTHIKHIRQKMGLTQNQVSEYSGSRVPTRESREQPQSFA